MNLKHLYAIEYQKDFLLTHAYMTKKEAEKDIKRISSRPLWDNLNDYKVIKITNDDINFIWLKDCFEFKKEILSKKGVS